MLLAAPKSMLKKQRHQLLSNTASTLQTQKGPLQAAAGLFVFVVFLFLIFHHRPRYQVGGQLLHSGVEFGYILPLKLLVGQMVVVVEK